MIKLEGIKERIVNSRYFSTVISVLIALFFVFIGFAIYFSNIRTNGQIARASQSLYQITNTDRSTVTFKYETNSGFSFYDKLFEKFYTFSAISKDGKIYDVQYLVDKKNLEVYIYDKQKMLIPYDDYVNQDSVLGRYFALLKNLDYDDIPAATRHYLNNNGGYAFLKKVTYILNNIDEEASVKCGGLVNYVDYILNGVNQKQLNDTEFWSD